MFDNEMARQKSWFIDSLNAKVFLVFAAFFAMILCSSLISSRILNGKLLRNVEGTMDETQAFVSYVLTDPEIPLNFICDNIEMIYNRGEGFGVIKAYMTECSSADFKERIKNLNYYSVFGYLEEIEEFYDGLGWQPLPDYNPKERPWYTASLAASGKEVITTTPYIDADSGATVVAYVRRLFDRDGNCFAVLCVDVKMEHIDDLVVNKRITAGSYGLMVDQDLRVIVHPNPEIVGELMSESNQEMSQFTNLILGSSNISMQRVTAVTGRKSLVFGRQINNGWYMIILIPEDEYYEELYSMIWIISILGFLLALALSSVLVKIDVERNKSNLASKQKSSFLSTMSHEIRTPMNAILGITEIQLQKENLDPQVREALEKTYASGDMLLGIINDILDLSKIEAGKLELESANYEIASLISDTVQLNMMRAGSKPIEFELSIDENMPSILCGDELRVKQILNNVLSNAFKYTFAGTVKLSVSAEPPHPAAMNTDEKSIIVVFCVSDTGQGMTEEQVDKLFDEYARFNQAANRSTEGTGLGMSITQKLVRMMGGDISVESVQGKGTKFTIRLPQGRTDCEALGREIVENLLKFRSSSKTQMKRVQITREPMPYGSVLVVDDVEMNIYVAKGLLAPYGLKIDSADSGFAAIERIKSGQVWDIIFMDHMMPEMDGIEAVKRIREMGYEKPVVALTANAVAGQAEIFLGNGFDDFISKPVDIRQLNAVLNKFIRDKQPPEVLAAQEEARKQAQAENSRTSGNGETENALLFADVFVRDAIKSLAVLEALAAKDEHTEDDLRKYIVHVHGMKSALANLGKMELSAAAMKLETTARELSVKSHNDVSRAAKIKVLALETPVFLDSLRALTEELKPKEEASAIASDEDRGYLLEKLLLIKDACNDYDEKRAEDIVNELKKKTWSLPVTELLNSITEHLLHSEFDEVVSEAEKFTCTVQP